MDPTAVLLTQYVDEIAYLNLTGQNVLNNFLNNMDVDVLLARLQFKWQVYITCSFEYVTASFVTAIV